MKMVWPIATATYAPILDLVETTMKPMPSARMGMVGSISHWARLPTMDPPFTHPGANISMTVEGAGILLQ